MKDLINDIYNNAINKVFGEKILREDGFDNLCYHQMIDETHSIVIWGDADGVNDYYYVISIRNGATNEDWAGVKEISCDATPTNSHEDLFIGIEEKIQSYFGSK